MNTSTAESFLAAVSFILMAVVLLSERLLAHGARRLRRSRRRAYVLCRGRRTRNGVLEAFASGAMFR